MLNLKNSAQVNLVPNYSFEDTVSGQICFSYMNINKAKNWYNPSNSTPDYVNICANTFTANYPALATIPQTCYGYQYPRSGNAMAGIGTYIVYSTSDSINYYSEYISVKLTDTLKSGECYYGEFYAVLADICEFNSNRLGMYISKNTFTTSIGSFTNTIQAQIEFDTTQYFTDTLNWVKISSYFIAQGGETHLTIGSFKDGNHIKKTGMTSTFNTQCNIVGDSHHIIYIYIDDVSLYKSTLPCGLNSIEEFIQKNNIVVYPNPTINELNVSMFVGENEKVDILIYGMMGNLIKEQAIQNQQTKIDLSLLQSGIYLYEIHKGEQSVKNGKFIIAR